MKFITALWRRFFPAAHVLPIRRITIVRLDDVPLDISPALKRDRLRWN
jgi:hypothetical protein